MDFGSLLSKSIVFKISSIHHLLQEAALNIQPIK